MKIDPRALAVVALFGVGLVIRPGNIRIADDLFKANVIARD
jgi:hypothetical protein